MRTPAHRRFAPQGTLPTGTRLGGDLTILGVLGEGGTGVVYRAQHSVLKREVAVKMCHAVVGAGEPQLYERLVREARMCASVKDGRVPRIYALDKCEDGAPYLVMEKVTGQPLAELLRRGRLHARVACQLGVELLRALEAVHRAQVIHRDVKPSNLIIDLEREDLPKLRLLDFGIGKALTNAARRSPALTRPGEVVGTPMYMAPEQMIEGAIDPRVDLYAAGIVLYEMLAGRPPFRAPSVAETFVAVLHDEMPRLDALRAGLPAALVELVHKATSKRPDARYASAEEMRRALEAILPEMEHIELGSPLLQEQNEEQCPTLVWRRDSQVEASGPQRRGARPLPGALARTLRKSERSPSGRLQLGSPTPVGFRAARRSPLWTRAAGGWLVESASL